MTRAKVIRLIIIVIIIAVVAMTVYYRSIPDSNVDRPSNPEAIVTPSELPEKQAVEDKPKAEPNESAETETENKTVIISEKELQEKLGVFVEKANQSGKAGVDYMEVKLEQDRMIISAGGTYQGLQAQVDDMEVHFEGMTIFATGNLKNGHLRFPLTTEIRINTDDDILTADVVKFELGGGASVLFKMLGLSKTKISEMVNGVISKVPELTSGLKSISIEDGKLIVEYK